jgi:hypothetical protein
MDGVGEFRSHGPHDKNQAPIQREKSDRSQQGYSQTRRHPCPPLRNCAYKNRCGLSRLITLLYSSLETTNAA